MVDHVEIYNYLKEKFKPALLYDSDFVESLLLSKNYDISKIEFNTGSDIQYVGLILSEIRKKFNSHQEILIASVKDKNKLISAPDTTVMLRGSEVQIYVDGTLILFSEKIPQNWIFTLSSPTNGKNIPKYFVIYDSQITHIELSYDPARHPDKSFSVMDFFNGFLHETMSFYKF